MILALSVILFLAIILNLFVCYSYTEPNALYYVRYVDKCSPKTKAFKTKEEAAKFVANFKLKHQSKYDEDDYWIDLVFKGDIIFDESSK